MSESGGRKRERPSLGHCPECDVGIPSASVLIEYETDDGWRRQFAECPGCERVVHPSGS
jgi:formate dehydrogenase maturation protein FdhE